MSALSNPVPSPASSRPILIATRGSALALAQANQVLAQCRAAFPGLAFELRIIKTTGDKLQTASLAQESTTLPKGLFTKELEVALLRHEADLAVHSLKDLPTELPDGLVLGAVGRREDVRDVLIYRDEAHLRATASARRGFGSGLRVEDLPAGAVVATSSTRRRAQLLARHTGLQVVEIRGNVATRLRKLAERPELDATILALAGMSRLQFHIAPEGRLQGEGLPAGLLASILDTDVMLPCVGQAAVGIEIRRDDVVVSGLCERLIDWPSFRCVTAERAFLAAMGGGCQSPVAAFAEAEGTRLKMRVVSFTGGPVRRAEGAGPLDDPVALGQRLAAELKR